MALHCSAYITYINITHYKRIGYLFGRCVVRISRSSSLYYVIFYAHDANCRKKAITTANINKNKSNLFCYFDDYCWLLLLLCSHSLQLCHIVFSLFQSLQICFSFFHYFIVFVAAVKCICICVCVILTLTQFLQFFTYNFLLIFFSSLTLYRKYCVYI